MLIKLLKWKDIFVVLFITCSHAILAQGVLLSTQPGFIPIVGKFQLKFDVTCQDLAVKQFVESRIDWHLSNSCNEARELPSFKLQIVSPEKSIDDSPSDVSNDIVIFFGVEPSKRIDCKALVYQPDHRLEALGETIDGIFGARSFTDTLVKEFGPFPIGSGTLTQAGLRLLDLTQEDLYSSLSDSLDQIVQAGLDSAAYPGAQLVVCHKNSVIHSKSYGYHSFDSLQPVESSHLYDLASLTKVAAGVPAIMYLVDRGLISLDNNFCQLWPFLCRGNKRNLNLRAALSHQAGLMPYIVFWHDLIRKNGKLKKGKVRNSYSPKYSVDIGDSMYLHRRYYRKMYRQVRRSDLLDSIQYLYSGLTFLLYPDLVKRKFNMRIDSFLCQKFYQPLGSNNTMFRPHEKVSLEKIVPTEYDSLFRKQMVHGRVHDEASAMLGGISTNAGLFSNALDLAKLGQMFLNRGTYAGVRFVTDTIVDEFTRRHFNYLGNRRGLGFDKPLIEWDEAGSYSARSSSQASYGHSGFTGTFMWIDPEKEIILVFLSNRVHPTRENRKLYDLGIRPRLHQAVYDWLAEKN